MADTIQGNAKGVWLEPERGIYQKTAKYTGVNTTEFRWGIANPGLPQENGLVFTGTPNFSTDFNQSFTLGQLSFFNSSMADTNTVVESVPLSIELGLDSLNQTKKFNFNLELETTLDVSDNPDDWADFVYFPSVLPKETFTSGGEEYTLEIVGFTKDGGKTLENRFNVGELEGDTADLIGKITVAPKQLPGGDRNSTATGAEEIKKITSKFTYENDDIGFTEGGVRDLSDMYEFTVDSYSQVNVTLDQLSQNANVEILDGKAQTILFQSTEAGRKSEQITEFLDKGNYFIRVYPEQTAKTKYRLGVNAKAVVGEKDTLGTSRDLGNLSSETFAIADTIGFGAGKQRDTQDYYKFSVSEKSEVLVTLDGLKADANIKLLDNKGNQLFSSENPGKKGEKIFEELPKGDYYLKVEPKGTARTDYVLSVKADPPESSADDKLPGIDLGTVNPDFAIGSPGEVGYVVGKTRDVVDYYSFKVEQSGEVKVLLDGFTGDVNIRVLDAQGQAVGESDIAKKSKIVTLEDAEPGNYSIEVKPGSNNRTAYGVSVTTLPPFVDDYPTYQTAYDFGAIAQGKKGVVNNKVGFSEVGRTGRDETDFFKFTIDKESLVDVNLGKLKQNADITLWQKESNGLAQLDQSREKGRAGEKILTVLDSGTYYVQVEPFGNERTNYQLGVNVQDPGIPVKKFAVGDLIGLGTYDTSNDIGLGTGVTRNQIDQYEFSLNASSDVFIDLDGLKQDADIYLFKKIEGGKQLIQSSTTRGKAEENITAEGSSKGDYILEVKPFGAAKTPYQLTMSTGGDIDPDGGNNGRVPSTAVQDLGALSSGKSFDDDIGFGSGTDRDQYDFYKFTVSQDTPVKITLSPDMANANLEVIDRLGSSLYSSKNGGTAKDIIDEEFSPGTYYVRVFPVVGDRTDYNLTISPSSGSDSRDPDGGPLPDDTDYVNDIRSQFASGQYTATDRIGFNEGSYRDVNDYRLFSVSERSNFSLDLTNLKQNADVFLYTKNYTQIASSTLAGITDESINKVIEAGDYYVRVIPKGTAQTTYSLNMSADPVTGNTDNVAPGNSLGTLGASPLTASELLGFNDGGKIDTVDYYNFISNSDGGLVNIDLKGLAGNADIEVFDATSKQSLGISNNSGTNDENISVFVEPDKNYLVKVFGQGSQTPYDLSVSLA